MQFGSRAGKLANHYDADKLVGQARTSLTKPPNGTAVIIGLHGSILKSHDAGDSMKFDDIDNAIVDHELPQYAPVEFIGRGGQKRVFKCNFEDETWALSFILVSDDPNVVLDPDDEDFGLASEQVIARLRREVAVISKCNSPHIVQIGPGDVTPLEIGNLSILYFLEEFIDGEDLKKVLSHGQLPVDEVKKIAIHVAKAIDELWNCDSNHRIVHRDLKPANIMRRAGTKDYVVLDIGFALDLLAESISSPGQTPGTILYFTPDQLDASKKRQMDFRTDMFALGVILYEAATGIHPFYDPSMSSFDFFKSISSAKPAPVNSLRTDVPESLNRIIMRLLAKKPHLRYRTCDALLDALELIEDGGSQ